ncbi:sodium:inorganic phosphate symporter [Atractiella rhizophila]|nr:sodium:inorganic phosphate symporter [Atractiella rhizophila]
MPVLHECEYLFAFGTIFAVLDAYMIGANDVANSWSTSVSSKTFTLRQAVFFAGIFEFAGAVGAGARVTGTIKNGIISQSIFEGSPGVQLLTFVVALFCSSTWLSLATRLSWPVSTTYSIISAIAGAGIAVGGFDAPVWGWNDSKGLAAIWAGLVIAPALSAGFAAAVYLIVKFLVLRSPNPTRMGLILGPFFFFLVTAICTMLIVYKGSPDLGLDDLSDTTIALAIVLTGLVVSILSIIFWVPFVRAKVLKKDYTIQWYHFFYGPLLWNRPAPADADALDRHVQDYRVRKEAERAEEISDDASDPTHDEEKGSTSDEKSPKLATDVAADKAPEDSKLASLEKPQIEGAWFLPRNLWIIVRYKVPAVLLHGSSVDVHAVQLGTGTSDEKRMDAILARAKQYPNETEHLFSFLQVVTACTASFAHGSNDLSNAIGPWSVIYYTWKNGIINKQAPVPTWQLVWGAAALVIGLATYGYNIMAVLGNRITLISPSRGFTMELGASLTVILASQYAIPVSTTMCITGATIGVALCNWDLRSINWKQIAHIYIGWIGTIVFVMIYSGCTMGIILNAPRLPSFSGR